MKKYSWKSSSFDVDVQTVGEELEEIERQGEITAEHVLEYAERHKDSELHKCFEWDDKEASRKYRLVQASQIICSISVEIKEEPKVKQRVYFSVKSSESNSRVFKNINNILENDDEYKQLIEKAKMEFDSCKDKYETLLNKEDLKEIIFEIYRKI